MLKRFNKNGQESSFLVYLIIALVVGGVSILSYGIVSGKLGEWIQLLFDIRRFGGN